MSPAYLSARPGGGKGQCCPILVSLGSELLLSLQPRGRWAGISLLTGCSLPLEAACFIAQKLADESWRLPRMDPTSPCSALEPPGEGDRDLVCPCLVKHLEPLVHSPRAPLRGLHAHTHRGGWWSSLNPLLYVYPLLKWQGQLPTCSVQPGMRKKITSLLLESILY